MQSGSALTPDKKRPSVDHPKIKVSRKHTLKFNMSLALDLCKLCILCARACLCSVELFELFEFVVGGEKETNFHFFSFFFFFVFVFVVVIEKK